MMSILLSLVLCIHCTQAVTWMTNYEKKFTFECPSGEYLQTIKSIHSDKSEDRVFNFSCIALSKFHPGAGMDGCEWTGDVNDFDGPIQFQCPNDTIIAGVSSYHANGVEDRKYSFRCCKPGYMCAKGWVFSGASQLCYKYSDEKAYNDNAKEKCRELGGGLATPKTKEELKAVLKARGTSSAWTWIGRDDKGKERRSVLNYGKQSGRPRNNCTELSSGSRVLNDRPCHYSNNYICQVPVVNTTALIAHACAYTPYENTYDNLLNFTVSDNKVIRGVLSVHSNNNEDRIFKFEVCKLDPIGLPPITPPY